MAYKEVSTDHMIRGTVLAIAERLFPDGIATVNEYAQQTGVAASTFRRGATWLVELLPELFRARRPGPRSQEEGRDEREDALRKLEDLRAFLADNRTETEKNRCYNGEAKQRIVGVSEEIQASGVLTYGEIATVFGIDERQLLRIRKQVDACGGAAPERESRRPKRTGELSEKIQQLIEKIQLSADDRSPYTAADVTRILKRNYKAELLEHHGSEEISETTVRKYLSKENDVEKKKQDEHSRGSWRYPEPFQQVAVDTSYFKLFDVTYYIITVFEFGGRLNLLTRVFLRDNTAAVVRVLQEYLEKFPGVEVIVIDRGTPYLNEEVKRLLESSARLRVVCPPETPTAKAAAERHFKTLKAAIRPAIERVLPEDPRWPPGRLVKILEMGVSVFAELYHQIPQEGIDGKTPAERIESFDPVRAAASLVDLFERAKNSEPSEDYLRHIHSRFQLPGDEKETVKRLRKYSTTTLRRLVKEVEPYMGPPYPNWMRDPLGWLCTKAREISERERAKWNDERCRKEKRTSDERQEKQRRENLERQALERRDHPERFVDGVLNLVVKCAERRFAPGRRRLADELRGLLASLARKLAHAFSSELTRLKERVRAFSSDPEVRLDVERLLDELAGGLSP